MYYTMGQQLYKYEHGLTAAEQRAADVRAGGAAAALRDLRRSLSGVLRFGHRARTTRVAMPVSAVPVSAVPVSRVTVAARTLPGIR